MPGGERTTLIGIPRSAPAAGGRVGLLVVDSLQPSLIGSFFELSAQPLVIGRGRDVGVHVEDQGMSRTHVRIERRSDGEFVAVDLHSTNGTWLNGVRISSAVLADGDQLQLGTGTRLRFGTQAGSAGARIAALAAEHAGAFEYDATSGALSFSGRLEQKLHGRAPGEPARDGWRSVLAEDAGALRTALDAAGQTGACETELRVLGADGETRWVAIQGEVFRDRDGSAERVAGTVLEITERNRAEFELRRQQLAFNTESDAMALAGADAVLRDWNPAAERLLALGSPRSAAAPRSLATLGSAELVRRVAHCVDAGERFEGMETIRGLDGAPLAVETIGVPLRDPDGVARTCILLFRDEGQRRRALAEMQMKERLASIGTLAAGVAHEINNPLAFIKSNLALVRDQLARAAGALGGRYGELDDSLADCQEGVERIRVIVQDLKTLSSGSAPSAPEPIDAKVDVNKVLRFALRVSEGEARKRARIVADLGELPPVVGGEARLGQVFLNLLLNAAQAIPEGKAAQNEIRLRSRHEPEAGGVVVEVSDTGCGIAPENLSRIFAPFFTTKASGIGTGLGLFVSRSIVAALGGEIGVHSAPGRGTTFRVLLPAARGR